jgi:chromosome segregation ATPase
MMILETIYQNSISLNEISSVYDNLLNERNDLIQKINKGGKKEEIASLNNKLNELNGKIERIKNYIIKLLANMEKMLDSLNSKNVKGNKTGFK